MIEKKLFSKLISAMLIAISGIVFNACGNNDEPHDSTETKWSTYYEVSFDLSDDVFKAAEVTAHIADPEGTMRAEKVSTSKTWTLKGYEIPDKAGILLTFVPKKNIPETEIYTFKINSTIKTASYKNNELFDFKYYSIESEISVKGDKVTQYFTDNDIALAYGVNANGTVISVDTDHFDFGLNGPQK